MITNAIPASKLNDFIALLNFEEEPRRSGTTWSESSSLSLLSNVGANGLFVMGNGDERNVVALNEPVRAGGSSAELGATTICSTSERISAWLKDPLRSLACPVEESKAEEPSVLEENAEDPTETSVPDRLNGNAANLVLASCAALMGPKFKGGTGEGLATETATATEAAEEAAVPPAGAPKLLDRASFFPADLWWWLPLEVGASFASSAHTSSFKSEACKPCRLTAAFSFRKDSTACCCRSDKRAAA
mmetsp:Transcript_96979/g.279085  ORF Transcript_96979/g.279085 Transcript_96979/m.279085 type:complete len:247 (+) Transcript_96979:1901-2641(+)